MNEKFTPGKWVARIEDHSFCDTGDVYTSFTVATEGAGKYDCFAEVFTRNDDIYEAAANTRLIAAAPEMYEALKKLKECIEDYFGKNEREFLKCGDKDVDGFFAQQYIAACNALKKALGDE